jgi:phage FluMu protein Com
MTIEFRCGQCNQLLRVPDHSAGKNARCPKCQALMQVPAAAGAPEPFGGGSAPFGGGPAPPPPPPLPGQSQPAFPSVTPPPPPPAKDDPFAFLNKPEPKPAAANPFGDAGAAPSAPPSFGSTPSVNPYASPGGGYSYQPGYSLPGYGTRPGLPWENKPQSVGTWWETTKLCLMQPTYAFNIMRQYGGMGQPMVFCAIGLGFGVVGQMLWYLPLIIIGGIAAGGNNAGGDEIAVMIGTQVVSQLVSAVFSVAIGSTVGLLIAAAIGHVCLMIVGGARQQYETTLRVIGYAQGSTAWLNVIPVVGGLVAFVWLIVIEIIGFAQAHETTMGKAALAVLLPIIVCFVCLLVGVLMFMGAIGAAMAGG